MLTFQQPDRTMGPAIVARKQRDSARDGAEAQRSNPTWQSLATRPPAVLGVQARDTREMLAPPVVHEALRSSGQPLDSMTRESMELRFGHDFSQVRMHTDAQAAESALQLSAAAYTVGRHIYFGAGQFRPGTKDGDRLIAHELAHAAQQGQSAGSDVQTKLDISQPGDAAEVEADMIADSVIDGSSAPPPRQVPVTSARKAIARADLKTNGGIFQVANYAEADTDAGKDTVKQVGAAIDITFTPAESIKSDKIAFVQIMKSAKGGVPYLFENEKPRATTAKEGDPGWAVDRVKGMKSPIYNQENDGTAASNTIFGYRKSKEDFKAAWMHDGVALNRNKGMTVTGDATAFALDSTNSKYLGAVSWGYATDASGKTTKKTEAVHAMGDPTGIQKSALEKWNEQAASSDVSKRNAPDQEKVPIP